MNTSPFVRAVRLGVTTATGTFGREIELGSGLNIVRGSNNRGKTQVIQAVIYGLGLERMLNARANAPLGSVFTTELIEGERSDMPLPVVSSWVEVEMVNSQGESFAARRYIVDSVRDQDIVQIRRPSGVADRLVSTTEDMFIHRNGGASRSSGFHYFLAQFLGWDLPEVGTFAGGYTKLYVDTLFPFMIVDQQAWGSVAPRKLNRYQIKDLSRKSVEYLLALTGPVAEMERNRLEAQVAEALVQWTATVRGMQGVASNSGARLVGVPALPAGAHRGGGDLVATELHESSLELLDGDEWVNVELYRARRTAELDTLRKTLATRTSDPTERDIYTQKRIADTRSQIEDVFVSLRFIQQDVGLSEARLASLDSRLGSLDDERLRNVDLRTLERLGAEIDVDHLAHHNCPTCQQSLDGVESDHPETVMGIEDTVALLNAQLLTTKKMKERSLVVATQLSDAEAGLTRRLDGLQLELRSLRADERAPRNISEGDVARKVTTEIRLAEVDRLDSRFASVIEELESLSLRVAELRRTISGLEDVGGKGDAERLALVAKRVQALLTEWGFGSYAQSRIELDADDLVPARDGFDLNVDVSASDVVRIKIAFLEAMREIGSKLGNHPGFLILDEPRQQDLDYGDFAKILQTLAVESKKSGQVIVSTSTSAHELEQMLINHDVTTIDIGDERLLKRLIQ